VHSHHRSDTDQGYYTPVVTAETLSDTARDSDLRGVPEYEVPVKSKGRDLGAVPLQG